MTDFDDRHDEPWDDEPWDDHAWDDVDRGVEGTAASPTRPSVPDPMDRLWRHPSEFVSRPITTPAPSLALERHRSVGSRRRWPRLLVPVGSAFAGAGATLLLVTAFGSVDLDRTEIADARREPEPSEASAVVNRLAPSIVAITASDTSGLRRGSGIVVRPQGEILTNARLVGAATTVDVLTIDGERVRADVVGVDRSADLALVRIDRELVVAPVAPTMPGIGQPIYAVGADRTGRATPRVSRGIVSSTDGLVSTPNGPAMSGLVEIDTLADHEWAGGALVDADGRVLGILFAPTIESRRTFALPISFASEIAGRLRVDGDVAHGRLGVTGVDTAEGPVVWEILDDPAAGRLTPGDVITSVGGRRVDTMAEVTAVVRRSWPDDVIAIEVRRGSRTITLRIRLGSDLAVTTTTRPG